MRGQRGGQGRGLLRGGQHAAAGSEGGVAENGWVRAAKWQMRRLAVARDKDRGQDRVGPGGASRWPGEEAALTKALRNGMWALEGTLAAAVREGSAEKIAGCVMACMSSGD